MYTDIHRYQAPLASDSALLPTISYHYVSRVGDLAYSHGLCELQKVRLGNGERGARDDSVYNSAPTEEGGEDGEKNVPQSPQVACGLLAYLSRTLLFAAAPAAVEGLELL